MKQSVKNSLALVLTAIYFGILVLMLEMRLHGDASEERLEWMQTTGTTAYLLNVLILFVIYLILMAVTNRFLISFIITNILAAGLTAVSYFKMNFLGENLYPWDLFLYNNVINLLPSLSEQINLPRILTMAAIGLAVIVALIVFIRLKKPPRLVKFPWWGRVIMALVGLLVLSSFIFYRSFPVAGQVLEDRFGIMNRDWNQNENYTVNGFFVAFLLNTQSAIVLPPSGYGKGKMAEIAQEIEEEKDERETEISDTRPNIIMIMNEAFWDPTLLSEDLKFNQDPMPNVREMQSGWFLAPVFGGGTANSEFEVLTGMSNAFLPNGSVPYQQYITSDIPALPNYLKSFGYRTLAVHPYPKWFWNRESVYQHMGFDDFIDIDRLDNPEYIGPYVGDAEVTREIVRQVEDSEDPLFLYAVTMQNHISYNPGRYEEVKITSQGGGLTPEMRSIVDLYAQGVLDADQALKDLMDTLEEPTVIVFFGDHMPSLGLDYQAYKEAGYVPGGPGEENWELADTYNMRRTPLVFWNNFGAPTPEVDVLSASFVAPYALEMAGIEQPLFYSFLDQMDDVMPGYTRDVKVDADGEIYYVTPDDVDPLRQKYMQIQYDILFGDQHSRETLFGKPE
ncbi:Lipoteichoic acid synthase 1 [Bhargavaea cecembensis DSE10]|uniref:Lipoteichoic acid synthase 1 n=1 Tax=Bhargavaea cecembensis DSE10 TaxID=1235279 RepID=M7NHA5_9BACL|nr:LTA synthase family protein [Bhargavaea cecembensis]EMR06627.1 Lipoteichoic acid synthase 1 [Bhargavaea cecembensis DSE10]